MREGCVERGGPPRISHAGTMCLAWVASKDMSCRRDVFSVRASKNKSSHAGRMCLALGPSRICHAGRMCLAGGPSRMQDGVARALPEQDGRFT
jgi:hypothetical protein